VASNFERIVFEAYGRDSRAVRALMGSLAQSRRFALSVHALSRLRAVFSAGRADEQETAATIRTVLRETGRLIDPHTAVGVAVAEKEPRDPGRRWSFSAPRREIRMPGRRACACRRPSGSPLARAAGAGHHAASGPNRRRPYPAASRAAQGAAA
jgi:threonine synthase